MKKKHVTRSVSKANPVDPRTLRFFPGFVEKHSLLNLENVKGMSVLTFPGNLDIEPPPDLEIIKSKPAPPRVGVSKPLDPAGRRKPAISYWWDDADVIIAEILKDLGPKSDLWGVEQVVDDLPDKIRRTLATLMKMWDYLLDEELFWEFMEGGDPDPDVSVKIDNAFLQKWFDFEGFVTNITAFGQLLRHIKSYWYGIWPGKVEAVFNQRLDNMGSRATHIITPLNFVPERKWKTSQYVLAAIWLDAHDRSAKDRFEQLKRMHGKIAVQSFDPPKWYKGGQIVSDPRLSGAISKPSSPRFPTHRPNVVKKAIGKVISAMKQRVPREAYDPAFLPPKHKLGGVQYRTIAEYNLAAIRTDAQRKKQKKLV